MGRLLRPQYFTVALLMVICLAVMTLVLPRCPDRICSLPIWVLIVCEYVFAFATSMCAQLQSLRQSFSNLRLAPAFVSLGMAFVVTAIGVIFSPVSAWGSDGTISIGFLQLTALNMALLFSIFTISTQPHPEFEEALTEQESSASNHTNIERLTKMRIRTPNNKEEDVASQGLVNKAIQNLKLGNDKLNARSAIAGMDTSPKLLPTKPTIDISTTEKPLIPPPVVSTDQNQKAPANELSPEMRRLSRVNSSKVQNKINQPKKATNSAISKLQGLSASGTGAAHISDSGLDSAADLKSVLDRLDNDDQVFSAEIKVESFVPNKQEVKLFDANVDNELEDIFAGIVPADAQKEVGKNESVSFSSGLIVENKNPQPVKETTRSVFLQPIEEEMDNLFAKIAPEAKPEIGKNQSSPENKIQIPTESKEERGIFKTAIDNEVEDIFSGMVSAEAQREVNRKSEPMSNHPTNQNFDATKVAPVLAQSINNKSEQNIEPKLFKEKVDEQVEDIFSGMVSAEAQREVQKENQVKLHKPTLSNDEITGDRSAVVSNFDPAVSEQRNTFPELNEFGRLSSRASAETESTTQAGTMKTIGKLLVDSDAVERLIKKGESGRITVNLPSAKVISELRGQGIQSLLGAIGTFEGVEGSMLIGEDGLVISSALATVSDREGTGVLAHGMLANSNLAMQKLDLGELEQMILVTNTEEGKSTKQLTTMLVDVEAGVLAVFLNKAAIKGLDNLIWKVSSIANG